MSGRRSTRDEVRVGILVLGAVTIFVVGLLWFQGFEMFRDDREVTATFPTTSGLIEGDPVEVYGVAAGEVERIRLDGGNARVVIRLTSDVALHRDARASVENVGIMGQKRIAIDPGSPSSGAFPEGATIEGESQRSVTDALGDMQGVAAAVESVAVKLDRLLAPVGAAAGSSLARSIESVEMTSDRLAARLGTDGEVARTLRATERTMAQVDSLIRSDGVRGTLANLERVTARLDTTLMRVDAVSARAGTLLAGIEDGGGTIGTLLTDEAFRDSLAATIDSARELIRDLRENPGRYVNVSIF